MVCFHLLPGYSTETSVWGLFFTLSYSLTTLPLGPSCLTGGNHVFQYTLPCFLSPTLQLGDFPLLSHVSLSGGHVSARPESPLPLALSCVFHHKAVWSHPLFLSKWFFISWGMSPFLLSSSQQPALLCLSLGSQQSFPAFPWPWLEPFGPSTGVCLLSHHFPQVLVPRLSPSLSSSLIPPTVNRSWSLTGPGTTCDWAEGGTHTC